MAGHGVAGHDVADITWPGMEGRRHVMPWHGMACGGGGLGWEGRPGAGGTVAHAVAGHGVV